MKPPVEYVRISAKGKDLLVKIKRNTGLEHWNEICRIALCQSLANPTPPTVIVKAGESAIDIEWKTFAGQYQNELSALIVLRAQKDGFDICDKEALAIYFRAHMERGIASIRNIKGLSRLEFLPMK